MATSLLVGTCLASFTLAKLPLPIVFSSLYLPMCSSPDLHRAVVPRICIFGEPCTLCDWDTICFITSGLIFFSAACAAAVLLGDTTAAVVPPLPPIDEDVVEEVALVVEPDIAVPAEATPDGPRYDDAPSFFSIEPTTVATTDDDDGGGRGFVAPVAPPATRPRTGGFGASFFSRIVFTVASAFFVSETVRLTMRVAFGFGRYPVVPPVELRPSSPRLNTPPPWRRWRIPSSSSPSLSPSKLPSSFSR
uniref:Secreted protein n=1 Tax=Anopheles darlingi TaxID=43151 RepID=A0A2M4D4Q1_ANODA